MKGALTGGLPGGSYQAPLEARVLISHELLWSTENQGNQILFIST